MTTTNYAALLGTAASTLSRLLGDFDSSITTYIENVDKMSGHLAGIDENYSDLVSRLDEAVTNSDSILKESSVINNLNTIISAGIVSNTEQKAILATMAESVGLKFSASDATLTRLERILKSDLDSTYLSIEYSLQKFLNQNFENSQYIYNLYENVAKNLEESLAIFSSNEYSTAIDYESSVQQWLGSYYSAGVSSDTVTSLSNAINKLSTGDLSDLDSGISKLLIMGASISGLDYGDLLMNDLTSDQVDLLMSGITSYLYQISEIDNNVVRSQLAKTFGFKISDLPGIANIMDDYEDLMGQSISANINDTLFADYSELISGQTKYENAFSNWNYTSGLVTALDEGLYKAYKIDQIVAAFGPTLSSIGQSIVGIEPVTGTVLQVAGWGLSNLTNITRIVSGLGVLGRDLFNLDYNDVSDMFNSLASGNGNTSFNYTGDGVSFAASIGESTSSASILENAVNSLNPFDTEEITGDEEDTEEQWREQIMALLEKFVTENISNQEEIAELLEALNR